MAARKQELMKIRGKLTGKKLAGIIWSGHGSNWTAKENYFQLEDNQRISVWLRTGMHAFWIRFDGESVEITLNRNRRKVVTWTLAVPNKTKAAGTT